MNGIPLAGNPCIIWIVCLKFISCIIEGRFFTSYNLLFFKYFAFKVQNTFADAINPLADIRSYRVGYRELTLTVWGNFGRLWFYNITLHFWTLYAW